MSSSATHVRYRVVALATGLGMITYLDRACIATLAPGIIRELSLSNEGVTLTDVFVAQGKVLMGVARWEWEQEEGAATDRVRRAAEHRTLQLRLSQAEAAARLRVVQTEMEARAAEIKLLIETSSQSALQHSDRATLRKMHYADDDATTGARRRKPGAVQPPRHRG